VPLKTSDGLTHQVRASRLAPVSLIASDSRLIASLIRWKKRAALIVHNSHLMTNDCTMIAPDDI
jgi:hypothetical protein